MGVQLVGIGVGAHHVQIFGSLRGIEKVPHSQRGAVSVPEHVPVGQCWVTGKCYSRVSKNGRRED